MPYNSFYINLNDNAPVTSTNLLSTVLVQSFADSNGTVGYFYNYITTQTQYNAFLYNPPDSNQILKIKNFDYKYNCASINNGFTNIIINRATGVVTSSIEPYEKLNTNSPDLPDGVGISISPDWSYTATGTFRSKPAIVGNMSITNAMQRSNYGASNYFNTQEWYSGQKTRTTVQDITLNSNQHLIIGLSSPVASSAANPRLQISVLFSSGSNTYYQDITTDGGVLYNRSDSTVTVQPAAFVNNSNTTIKIHRIEINIPGRDVGFNQSGLIQVASWNQKGFLLDHVTADRVPNTLVSDLVNADVFPITSLDSTISPPSNVKCYRSCVQVRNPAAFESGIPAYGYIRGGRLFNLPNVGNYMNLSTNQNALMLLNNGTATTIQKIKFNKSGQEIIIRPGEGLGLAIYNGGTVQDIIDGYVAGYITLTVESINSTNSVETGFGY